MESVKTQAFRVFDLLSEHEQTLIYELMIRLVPDDTATPEDLVAHAVAMDEYRRGETVAHEDIDWN